MCVDSKAQTPRARSAFCTDKDDFLKYTLVAREKEVERFSTGASQVGLPSTGVASSQYAIEALLTSVDSDQSLNASSFGVQAQKAVNVHGHVFWQTLPGGMSFCTNCTGLSVDPVPDGTQSVAVDVMLKPGVQSASLWLGSILMS